MKEKLRIVLSAIGAISLGITILFIIVFFGRTIHNIFAPVVGDSLAGILAFLTCVLTCIFILFATLFGD